MHNKKTIAPTELSLRQRAEENVKEKGRSTHLSEVDVRALCHELEVHQIELEMQNDELRLAQLELAASEEKYRDLYEFAPIGYLTLEGSGKVLEANLAAASILGKERAYLVNIPFQACLGEGNALRFKEFCRSVIDSDVKHTAEFRLRGVGRNGQAHSWILIEGRAIQDDINHSLRIAIIDISERKRVEEALRESRAQLQKDLIDTKLLQSISAELLCENNIQALYEKIIDAAARIMRSEYASMQMLYPERGRGGELRLLAFRGFSPEAAKFWEWVGPSAGSTCSAALRTGQRVIVPDVEKCDYMQGTEDLTLFLQTGIHACQTTPLFSRDGKIVGMISTHWQNPHQPSERDLRLFDVLARQAADIIEHRQAEEALRKSKDELEMKVQERTAELKEANEELEVQNEELLVAKKAALAAAEAKAAFMANMPMSFALP